MTPLEFKTRYVFHIRSNPDLDSDPELQELRDELCEFEVFDLSVLTKYAVDNDSVKFLTEAGLPRTSAPFLGFKAHRQKELEWLYATYELPASFFPIGSNGYGDLVGIEVESRAIVYLMHDAVDHRVFINSSIEAFAEALCLYQELRAEKRLVDFHPAVASYDPAAVETGAMWSKEGLVERTSNDG